MGVACLSTCNISFERRDCSSTPTFSIPKPLGPLRADNLCSATSLGQLGYSASTKFCRPLHKKNPKNWSVEEKPIKLIAKYINFSTLV